MHRGKLHMCTVARMLPHHPHCDHAALNGWRSLHRRHNSLNTSCQKLHADPNAGCQHLKGNAMQFSEHIVSCICHIAILLGSKPPNGPAISNAYTWQMLSCRALAQASSRGSAASRAARSAHCRASSACITRSPTPVVLHATAGLPHKMCLSTCIRRIALAASTKDQELRGSGDAGNGGPTLCPLSMPQGVVSSFCQACLQQELVFGKGQQVADTL